MVLVNHFNFSVNISLFAFSDFKKVVCQKFIFYRFAVRLRVDLTQYLCYIRVNKQTEVLNCSENELPFGLKVLL